MADQQSLAEMSLTASKDPSSRISQLHSVFQLLDTDGSGRLDSQAMRRFAELTGFSGGDAEWQEEFRLLCEELECTARDGLDEASFIELINDPAGGCSFCSDHELHEIHKHLTTAYPSSASAPSNMKLDNQDPLHASSSKERVRGQSRALLPNMRKATKRKIFWLLCPAGHGNTIGSSELQLFAQLTGFEGDDTEWNREFGLLCQEAGVTNGSLSEDVFVSLLDDVTDRGMYCNDDELVKIAEKLAPSLHLPVPWHRTRSARELRSLRTQVSRAIFNVLDVQGSQLLSSNALRQFATLSGFEYGDVEWHQEFYLLCKERGCKESDGLAVDDFLQLVDDTSEHGCYCNDATLIKILASLTSQYCEEKHREDEQRQLDFAHREVPHGTVQQGHPVTKDDARVMVPVMDQARCSSLADASPLTALERAREEAELSANAARVEAEICKNTWTERQEELEARAREQHEHSEAELKALQMMLIEKGAECQAAQNETKKLKASLREAQEFEQESVRKEQRSKKWEHDEMAAKQSLLEMHAAEISIRFANQNAISEKQAELLQISMQILTKEHAYAQQQCEQLEKHCNSEAKIVANTEHRNQLLVTQRNAESSCLVETQIKNKSLEAEIHMMQSNFEQRILSKDVEIARLRSAVQQEEHAWSFAEAQLHQQVHQKSRSFELEVEDLQNKLAQSSSEEVHARKRRASLLKNYEIQELNTRLQEQEAVASKLEMRIRDEAEERSEKLELRLKELGSEVEKLNAAGDADCKLAEVQTRRKSISKSDAIVRFKEELEEQQLIAQTSKAQMREEAEERSTALEEHIQGLRSDLENASAEAAAQMEHLKVQRRRTSMVKQDTIVRMREELVEQQELAHRAEVKIQDEAEERSARLEDKIQGLHADLEQTQVSMRKEQEMFQQEQLVMSTTKEAEIESMQTELVEMRRASQASTSMFEIKDREDHDPRTRAVEAQLEALRNDLQHISEAVNEKRRVSDATARRKSLEKLVEIEQMQAELQEHDTANTSKAENPKTLLKSLTWPRDQRKKTFTEPEQSDATESSDDSDDASHRGTELQQGSPPSPQSPCLSSGRRQSQNSVRFSLVDQKQEFIVDQDPSDNSQSSSQASQRASFQSEDGQDDDDNGADASSLNQANSQDIDEDQDSELLSNYDDDTPPGEQDINASSFFTGDLRLESTELTEVFRMEEIGYCRKGVIEHLYHADEGAKVMLLHLYRRHDEPMLSTLLRINKAGSLRREFEHALVAQEFFGELAPRVVGSSAGLARLPAGAVAALQLELMGSMCSLPGFTDAQKSVMLLGHLFAVCRDQGLTGQHTVWPKFFSFLQALFRKIAIPSGSLQRVTLEDIDIREHLNLKPVLQALVPGMHPEQLTGDSKLFGTESSIDALVLEHFSSQFLSEEDDLAHLELMVEELYYSGLSDGPSDGGHGRSELTPVMFFLDLIIDLSNSSEFSTCCRARMGYVHGDLHLNNVLYDEHRGVDNERTLWIMDFENLHRGHQFVDLARCLTVGLFLHSRVDDFEREQHLRSLVRIIASTPFLTSNLPEPEPETPGSVRFIWAFTAQMLAFCKDIDEDEEEDTEESGLRTSTQLIWALLYSSLQLFADCRKWQNARRKRLVMYACIAFALRLRLELHGDPSHMPRWLGNDREAWNQGHLRRATMVRHRNSGQAGAAPTASVTPWFAMQFLKRLHHQQEEQRNTSPLEQHAAKCYLQGLCEELAWASDPFTGVSYSVLSECSDLNLTQPDQTSPSAMESFGDNCDGLQKLLEKRRRVLIAGAAGSGKTLQTRHLLTSIAKHQLRSVSGEVRRLPVRASFLELVELTVKKFNGAAPPAGKLLEAYMEMHMSPQCCTMFQLSREQGWLLILDGAEDALGHNEVILEWLDRLLEQEPRHHVLMTARPEALREAVACADTREGGALLSNDWLQQQGFVVLHMRQVTRGDLWRMCMRHHGSISVEARKKLFVEVQRPEYKDVVTTPLMALMTLHYAQNQDMTESEDAGGLSDLGPPRVSAQDVNAVFLYKFSFAKMLERALAQSTGGEADENLFNRLSDAIAQICSTKQEQHSRIIVKADFEGACQNSDFTTKNRLMELWHLAMCGQFNLFERVGTSLRVFQASMQDFLAATHAWTVIERGGDMLLPGWLLDPGLNFAGAPFNTRAMLFFADLAVKRRSIISGQFAPLLKGIGAVLRLVAALGNRRATKNLASLPISLEDRRALLETRSFSGGWSALHLACAAGHDKVVNFLLEWLPAARPSLLMLRDDKQRIPLHLAAVRRTSVVLNQLLAYIKENPAMLDASDIEGKTALNRATGSLKMRIVKSSFQVGTSNAARLRGAFLRQPTM